MLILSDKNSVVGAYDNGSFTQTLLNIRSFVSSFFYYDGGNYCEIDDYLNLRKATFCSFGIVLI